MPKRGTCSSCRPQGRLRTSWEGSWPPSVDAAGKDVVVNLLCMQFSTKKSSNGSEYAPRTRRTSGPVSCPQTMKFKLYGRADWPNKIQTPPGYDVDHQARGSPHGDDPSRTEESCSKMQPFQWSMHSNLY